MIEFIEKITSLKNEIDEQTAYINSLVETRNDYIKSLSKLIDDLKFATEYELFDRGIDYDKFEWIIGNYYTTNNGDLVQCVKLDTLDKYDYRYRVSIFNAVDKRTYLVRVDGTFSDEELFNDSYSVAEMYGYEVVEKV
jgi:hypothetical protein